MCNHPKAGYEEVLEKLVKYCQGHPLALKVLGKSLHNRDVAYWEACIQGLKKETCSCINNVLRMSFDYLPSNNDKELFKHIACFFVGIDRDVTETILEACNINMRSEIINFIDRCLLSIGRNNEFKMHQLVQEMERFEVLQESLDKPWKRSRLWCHEESFKGKGNILGLALDMRMVEKDKSGASFEVKIDALSNMDNLMLLQLNYVHMNGSYENFPEELRCLCMHGYRLNSIPLNLPMENLVALDNHIAILNHLSFVIVIHNDMKRDKSLGDFDQLPALKWLIVRNCIGLHEVCESIGQCVKLVLIDLSYCNKLEKIQKIIGMLRNVKIVFLDHCNLGESRIKIRDIDLPERLKANNIDVNTITSSSTFVGAIPSDLKFSAFSLPRSLVSLTLANNNLSTESFPMDFSCLSTLEHLYLDGNLIDSMPICVRTLPRLEILSMNNCKNLKSIEHPPHTLRALFLASSHRSSIEKLVLNRTTSILRLSYDDRNYGRWSYEIEGVVKIQAMVGVEEEVLCSLGWTNLDFRNDTRVRTNFRRSGIQTMHYEFGIFTTMYEAEEMPSWFRHRSAGPSILFTIPSTPNCLRGFNFCSVQTLQVPYKDSSIHLSTKITISNITKNRTWIYRRLTRFSVCQECCMMLSHWMFGMNDMEGGDQVTITIKGPYNELIKECGVRVLYDDDDNGALDYYKSWNHIIGGDLSCFQTTGEYILRNWDITFQFMNFFIGY
ncbi:unnamed protein product [Lactuca saligna]|uniref:Uncharacterized protein n=1 Tax=Lactuca saligna TaxID=75948 RepID=A0AA35Y6S7_LACSI|nr:unnamed protein product [Lactuca saligna]